MKQRTDMPTGESQLPAAARALLGTPFRHQGRSPAGLDCVGLVLLSAEAAGLKLPEADRLPHAYPRHPDGRLPVLLAAHLLEADPTAPIAPGEVLLFRIEPAAPPSHVAIASRLPDGRAGLIHAFAPARRVVEHGFAPPWPQRLAARFLWPVPETL